MVIGKTFQILYYNSTYIRAFGRSNISISIGRWKSAKTGFPKPRAVF